MRYISSFFIFSFYLYGFNYHLKPYNISEGIDCFFGLPSQVNKSNGGNMINSCYIETSDGYVVIDSGPTYSYAQQAYGVMKEKKKLPVKYVINTSVNEVHVLGNEFYKELGAKILAPQGYEKYFEENKTLVLKNQISKDAFLNTRVVPIDRAISKDEVLKFSHMQLEIKLLEGDNRHLYVYVKDKDIVFTGDFIFNNRLVPIAKNRFVNKWLKEIEKIEALKWSDLISSHGYMTRRSALKNTKSYLSLLQIEILKRIKTNESRADIIDNVKLASFENMKFYEIWHRKNVAKVYDELMASIQKDKKEFGSKKIIKKEVIKKKTTPKKLIEKKISNKNKTKIKENNITKSVLPKKIELQYKTFQEAMNIAKRTHKIVLIKVRSSSCKYCDQLDRILDENAKVQKLLNKYFELVLINMDEEAIPMGLVIQSTPTLIFIRPDNEQVLMKLAGIRALGELLEILHEAVDDGHAGAYLQP